MTEAIVVGGVLVACVLIGGGLLYAGGRFLVRASGVTYGRSVVTYLLSGLAGLLVLAICRQVGMLLPDPLPVFATALGLVLSLIVTWAIIARKFNISLSRAFVAWVPTLALLLLAASALISGHATVTNAARDQTARSMCAANLRQIGQGFIAYGRLHPDEPPPLLEDLVRMDPELGHVAHCPAAGRRTEPDYFFVFPQYTVPPDTIIGCELSRNHGNGRNVLFADASATFMPEEEFRRTLAAPANQVFAEAFRRVEKPELADHLRQRQSEPTLWQRLLPSTR